MAARSVLTKPGVSALVCFALTLPALVALKSHTEPHYSISQEQATRIAKDDPRVARDLADSGYTRIRVSPLDDQQQRVSFFNGSRLILHASIGPQPKVTRIMLVTPGAPNSGSTIANAMPVLAGLTLLFMLMTATVPLLSLRNLDVLVFASLTLTIWLINEGLMEASVLVAYALLAYLSVRLLWRGFVGDQRPVGASLFWHLTADLRLTERRRILKIVLAGMTVMATGTIAASTGVNDVAFAALAGATDLMHATVPYGHIPDFIVHGDTYPPLTYVIYLPGALLSPVTNLFSDPEGALIVVAVATMLVAWGLFRALMRAAPEASVLAGAEPPSLAGMRAAIAWLAFPPMLVAASGGTNDVVLAVFIVAALASLAQRRRSVMWLGVGAWVKLTPAVALPIWLARLRGRELGQAIIGLAALSVLVLGSMVALGGFGSLGTMAHALSFQFGRGSLSSLWTGWGLGALQPVAQAAVLATVVGAALCVRRDEQLRDDLPRLAALLAGVLLLTQFAANYWTWAYLPWAIAPALLVLVPVGNAFQGERASSWTQVRVSAPHHFSGTY